MNERINLDDYFDSEYYQLLTEEDTKDLYGAKRYKPDLDKQKKLKKLDKQSKIINGILTSVLSIVLVVIVAFGVKAVANSDMLTSDANNDLYLKGSQIANGFIRDDIKAFSEAYKLASIGGEELVATLNGISYLNNLASDSIKSYGTEYELLDAFNSSKETFKINYNNLNINIDRALVNSIDTLMDSSYINLGTFNNSLNQIVIKCETVDLSNFAKTLKCGDIISVKGICNIIDDTINIRANDIKKLNKTYNINSVDYSNYVSMEYIIDRIFGYKDLTVINNAEPYNIKVNVKRLIKFSDDTKGFIVDSGCSNVNIYVRLDEQSEIIWDAIYNSSLKEVELLVCGNIGISDISDKDINNYYIFINNALIDF